MTREIIKLLEDNNWFIAKVTDGWNLSQYSPAGEDFSFTVDDKNLIENILNYVDKFDVDDHVAQFVDYLGVHGVPNSISLLVDDTRDIHKMLITLKDAIIKKFGDTRCHEKEEVEEDVEK